MLSRRSWRAAWWSCLRRADWRASAIRRETRRWRITAFGLIRPTSHRATPERLVRAAVVRDAAAPEGQGEPPQPALEPWQAQAGVGRPTPHERGSPVTPDPPRAIRQAHPAPA